MARKETHDEMLARMQRMREKVAANREAKLNIGDIPLPKKQHRNVPPTPGGYKPVSSEPVLKEAPPPDLFSGQYKNLEVFGRNGSATDPIPGFRLYWFTDTDGMGIRIEMAKRSGYEHVRNDEVLCNESIIGGNDDVGTHVRKLSNIHSGRNGEKPIYQYLMKKPLWLYQHHEAERDKVHQRQEDEIRRGRISKNPDDKQYVPGSMGSRMPAIEVDPKLYR